VEKVKMPATTCVKLASIPSQERENLIAAKIAAHVESELTRTRFWVAENKYLEISN
jgi:hypothetical protein